MEDDEFVHVEGAAPAVVGVAQEGAASAAAGAAHVPAAQEAAARGLAVTAQQVASMLNRRGRVLTSFSLVHLISAHSNWDAPLVEILGEGGMAVLLALRPGGNTDRLFCMWLLSLLDPVTMILELGSGRDREINVMEIRRILGLVGGVVGGVGFYVE